MTSKIDGRVFDLEDWKSLNVGDREVDAWVECAQR